MKKVALLLMATAIGFTACKKDKKEEQTNAQKIVGTWKLDYRADDMNENGIMDESEKESPAAGDYEYGTFNANGTFKDSLKMSGFELVVPGTWSIINGDQIIVSVMGTTDTGTIQQLDASRLTFKSNETPSNWTSYIKQ